MHALHRAIYVWRIVLGVAWGGLLDICGLYVLSLTARSPDDRLLQMCLGITALAAGNFIFMAIVADRVILYGPRGALDTVEFSTGGIMLAGALASAYVWVSGGGY